MSVRPLPSLLVFVLGVAASVLVACGDSSNLIPPDDASRLKDRLSQVRSAVEAGDCEAAIRELERVRAAARQIPSSVDRRLRERINEGVRTLEREVPEDCMQPQTQPTETQPTVTQTTPPETTATETTTTPETTPTETTTTPPETTTTEPPPTDTGGGTGGTGGTGGIEPDQEQQP